MAKRPSVRAIKAARTYTIEEAAHALGITPATVRAWAKSGLPVMRSRRPYLILGEALRDFLAARTKKAKAPLGRDQLYCLRCKAPRIPMWLMVDCVSQTPNTARLVGLCEVCGGTCNRMISRDKISDFARVFDLAINDARQA